MKNILIIVVLMTGILFLALPGFCFADIIPADRVIDWSYAGVPGGIPNRTTIYQSLGLAGQSPAYVQNVTTAQINSAIASCPANQVVYLNAGTYNNIGTVNFFTHSRVTLRGAGPGATISKCTTGGECITTDQYGWTGATAITGGYTKGSTSISVANAAGFSVGNMIKLDQNDDPALVLTTQGSGRNLTFAAMVTAINGNTLTLSTPLPYGFSSALAPQASYLWGGPGVSWVGVEDMTINNTNGANDIISFWAAYACWIKNVEMVNADTTSNGNNAFAFFVSCLQCEMRDSYLHHAQNAPNNSDGYGIYIYNTSAYNKVENNIFDTMFGGLLQSGASANAYLYNYCRNDVGQGWPHQVGAMNANHGAHPLMSLWEGNVGEQWQSDGYHGSASHQTIFRNWFHGLHPVNTDNRKMIDACRGSYHFNVVGNVLGSSWATSANSISRYEMTGEPGYNEQQVIYRLGYPNMGNNGLVPGNPWPYSLVYPDAKVKNTMMRWGNFDYFHGSAQWNASEIPSGVAVPSTQTLPASLYYTSKPAWWPSGTAWPPIGPDVTGGAADPAGYVGKIPAQACYDNSAKNANGELTNFNANTCYYAASTILYGDVSENGSVTAYDASMAAQYAVGSITLTSAQITKADVSGNGSVTSYDASLIAQYAVGLITKFPVQG